MLLYCSRRSKNHDLTIPSEIRHLTYSRLTRLRRLPPLACRPELFSSTAFKLPSSSAMITHSGAHRVFPGHYATILTGLHSLECSRSLLCHNTDLIVCTAEPESVPYCDTICRLLRSYTTRLLRESISSKGVINSNSLGEGGSCSAPAGELQQRGCTPDLRAPASCGLGVRAQ